MRQTHGRVAILVCLLALPLLACAPPEPVSGTELSAAEPAAPFQLQDQFGNPRGLADYSGKVTVLTFLYTSCPDMCPVVARHLKSAHEALEDRSSDVQIVIITVDPERDTVERAHEYSERWDMLDGWDYLVGDEPELTPVWAAYYVAQPARLDDEHESAPEDGDVAESGSVAALGRQIAEQYLVDHSSPVYLIDRDGLLRVLFTLPFDPADLAHDVRLLLDSNG